MGFLGVRKPGFLYIPESAAGSPKKRPFYETAIKQKSPGVIPGFSRIIRPPWTTGETPGTAAVRPGKYGIAGGQQAVSPHPTFRVTMIDGHNRMSMAEQKRYGRGRLPQWGHSIERKKTYAKPQVVSLLDLREAFKNREFAPKSAQFWAVISSRHGCCTNQGL